MTCSPVMTGGEPVGCRRTALRAGDRPGQRSGWLPTAHPTAAFQGRPGNQTNLCALRSALRPGGFRPATAAGRRFPRRSVRAQLAEWNTKPKLSRRSPLRSAPSAFRRWPSNLTSPRSGSGCLPGGAGAYRSRWEPMMARISPPSRRRWRRAARSLAERLLDVPGLDDHRLTSRASALSRAAVWSIQRRSASGGTAHGRRAGVDHATVLFELGEPAHCCRSPR